MFKFGDKAQVTATGFYLGSRGIIVYYSTIEDKYTLLLEHNQAKDFYPSQLKKLTKRGKK